MLELLAQGSAELPTTTEIGGWIGAATTSTILGWYLWYTVSRVTPAREEKHDALMAAVVAKHDATVNRLVEKHDATVGKLVQDFRDERRAAQTDFKLSLAAVVEHCAQENSRFIAALERSHPSNDRKPGGQS